MFDFLRTIEYFYKVVISCKQSLSLVSRIITSTINTNLDLRRKPTMTNLDYFHFFLRYKINSGVKQIDLARSEHVPISKQYLSRIIKTQPKNCSIEIQTGIAKYFGLTYDEMIAEAKRLYKRDKEETRELEGVYTTELSHQTGKDSERRSKSPLSLMDLTSFLQTGIRENYNYTLEVEKERDSLVGLINSLKTCICIADADLKVIYQNPSHRQLFGNMTGHDYSFFWDNTLSKEEIIEKLTTDFHDCFVKEHEGLQYKIQFSLRYSGVLVDQIVEQIVPGDMDHSSGDSLKHMEIYLQVFKHLDNGFGFFNNKRELELASNKFGFLDQYDFPNIRPSVDQLLLDLSEKLEGGLDKLSVMKKAYENKQEVDFKLTIDRTNYNFQTKNISLDNKHIGILLIIRKLD